MILLLGIVARARTPPPTHRDTYIDRQKDNYLLILCHKEFLATQDKHNEFHFPILTMNKDNKEYLIILCFKTYNHLPN